MSEPKAQVSFEGCRVAATMDGAGGWVVRVYAGAREGGESLLAIHVPSPAQRDAEAVQYWTATEWGGLLLRMLYAQASKAERAAREAFPKAKPAARKWGGK